MKVGWRRTVWGTAFFLYLCALFKIIVLKFKPLNLSYMVEKLQLHLGNPEYVVANIQSGNLVPLKEISRILDTLTPHSLYNLFGNIFVFIPLGLLLCQLHFHKATSFFVVLFCSFSVSLGLELTQAFFSIGTFDVDDMILNTLGGCIGYLLYESLMIISSNSGILRVSLNYERHTRGEPTK